MRRSIFNRILIIAFLAGCSFDHVRKDLSPKEEQRPVRLCFASNIRSLDPGLGVDGCSTIVIKMLFEGLMYRNEEGDIVPALARHYTVSEDKKTYTFYLRDSQWSNGMAVTAHDFEYAWKKVISHNQTHRSIAIHQFYMIKNVSAYLSGKCSLAAVGIQALDEKTFQVRLMHPVPYFLEAVTTTPFFPVCKEEDLKMSGQPLEKREPFVSNGPFLLKKYQYDNKIFLTKNPYFWDTEKVRVPGIEIFIVQDGITRLSLFEKGKIDWVGQPFGRLPIDALEHLKAENKLTSFPALGIYWYVFNTERPPFNNKKMRKAFALAIHREEIVNHILEGGERSAMGIFPGEFGFQTMPYFQDYHLTRARSLFREALDEMKMEKHQLSPIVISYNIDETHAKVAAAVSDQLFHAFGIKIRLKPAEWSVHFSGLVQGDFSLGGSAWHSWLRDPIYTLQAFANKKDGINWSRWENKYYQNLIARSEEEMDQEQRKELLHEAERVLLEELPVLPIYFTSLAFAKIEELKGVFISELYLADFRHAYFERELK